MSSPFLPWRLSGKLGKIEEGLGKKRIEKKTTHKVQSFHFSVPGETNAGEREFRSRMPGIHALNNRERLCSLQAEVPVPVPSHVY